MPPRRLNNGMRRVRRSWWPRRTQSAAVFLLRTLVAVFAVDYQAALVYLDVDVFLDVNTRQLQADDRVVAVLDDLRGRPKTGAHRLEPVRRRGGAEEVAHPPVGVPGRSRPQCEVAHGSSSLHPYAFL